MEASSVPQSRLLIFMLGILSALVAMAMDMYLPSMPAIAKDLSADFGKVQQTLSVFLVGIAFSQFFYGPLSDRFGRRPVLMAGLAIFSVTSFLCTLVTDIDQLISVRLLQSLGAGAGSVIVAAIVRDLYQREQAARVMSYVVMVMMVVPLIAPIVGGYILLWFGWRGVFWLLTLLGLVGIAGVLTSIPESLPSNNRQSLAIGAVLRSYREIVCHREAMGYALCSAFAYGCLFAFISGSPFVYIEYFGVSAQYYGYLFGCNIVVAIAISYLNSHLLKYFSSPVLLFVAVLIQLSAGAVLLLVSIFELGGVVGTVIPILACVGLIATVNANSTTSTLAYFPHLSGTASGVLGVSRFAIAGLASGAVGLLHDGSNLIMPAVMLICTLIAILCLVLLARVRSFRMSS